MYILWVSFLLTARTPHPPRSVKKKTSSDSSFVYLPPRNEATPESMSLRKVLDMKRWYEFACY